MNYFELLLCKYTWFWAKVSGYKTAGSYEFLKAVYFVILFVYLWPMALLFMFWDYKGSDKELLSHVIAIFYITTAVAVNFYYDKIRKERRIIYNIDYMRSRKGTLLAILFTLLSWGQIFVWPLIFR